MPRVDLPALSPEMEFIAANEAIAERVREKGKGAVRELTEAVWDRADEDASRLLSHLRDVISDSASSIFRIEWINRSMEWQSTGRLFKRMGPKRRIALIGVYIDNEPMPVRVVAWIWPKWGGLDGRRELVRACQERFPSVCLASEHPDRYPAWAEDDGIVWFEERLSAKTSLEDLMQRLRTRAKAFLKSAKPVLEDLAS